MSFQELAENTVTSFPIPSKGGKGERVLHFRKVLVSPFTFPRALPSEAQRKRPTKSAHKDWEHANGGLSAKLRLLLWVAQSINQQNAHCSQCPRKVGERRWGWRPKGNHKDMRLLHQIVAGFELFCWHSWNRVFSEILQARDCGWDDLDGVLNGRRGQMQQF